MITYQCDMCGKENLNKYDITILENFPRIVRTYAKTALDIKLCSVDKMSREDTHLCMVCCSKLANLFPIIEED